MTTLSGTFERLIDQGSWMSVEEHGLVEPIGHAQLMVDHIKYMNPYPSDQSNVHKLEFDFVEVHNRNGVTMRKGGPRGTLVAYLAPARQWPEEVDQDAWADLWKKWFPHFKKNQRRYEEFMEAALEE